jgi:ABC-type uncharacterized transport system ATPase subunit
MAYSKYSGNFFRPHGKRRIIERRESMTLSVIHDLGEIGDLTDFILQKITGHQLPSTTEESISRMIGQTKTLEVTDDATCQYACYLLFLCKEIDKEIKKYFKPHKENIGNAWKALCDAEINELTRLKPIVDHIMRQIYAYSPDFKFSCNNKVMQHAQIEPDIG